MLYADDLTLAAMTQFNCRKCWDDWNRMLSGKDLQ
jgi:hypothetical protein